MAYIEYSNTNSPQSIIQVWVSGSRNKNNVTLNATCTCSYRYSDGWIGSGHTIDFNFWCSQGSTTSNVKTYSETWRASSQLSRTVYSSISFSSIDTSSIQIGCNVTHSGGNSMSMPDQYAWVDYGSFNAPSAPTWFSISPNPCEVNARPTLTWGGASAGSMGTLYYDVEVQSYKTNGTWTDWLRISSAQSGTSYSEIAMKNMSVYGQTPFIGVKYQYRVRSSDGSYTTSGWVYQTLNVSFISPSSPTSSSWSPTTIKLHPTGGTMTFKLSWSGASGGSGTISRYNIQLRAYHQDTSSWSSWSSTFASTSQNKTFTFPTDVSTLGTFKNNDYIQARIQTQNSWGATSTYLTTGNVIVRGNQLWIKVNETWVEGDCFIKNNGTWVEGTPYVKVNGAWQESS